MTAFRETATVRRALLAGGLLALLLVGRGAPDAHAGTYDVVSCASAPGFVNNAWTSSVSGSGSTWYSCPPGSGMSATVGGSAWGASSRSVFTSELSASSASGGPSGTAQWSFTAPAGTSLQSFNGTWWCSVAGGFAAVSFESPSGGTGTGTCSGPGFKPVSRTFNAGATTLQLRTSISCSGHLPSCNDSSGQIALGQARVTLAENGVPALNVTGGSIPAGNWVGPTADIRFDASDTVGIRAATLSVDGTEKARRDFSCDFTRPVPCSNHAAQTLSFGTSGLANGTHTARLTVIDAAGNQAHYDRTFAFTNAEPAYPSGAGQAPIFSFETDRLTDRAQLMVNLGSGNLHYAQNDLSIEGTGLPLVVDRFYNSRGGGLGMFGQRWHGGVGQDVRVTELSGGDVEFQAPSFFEGVFRKQTDGSFKAPLGLRASLEKGSDGVWTITYDKSDVKLRFAGPGNSLSAIRDPHDNELRFDFDGSGRVNRLTDTQDRVTTFDYEAGGRVKELKDSTGRTAAFSYDGAGDLVQMTDLNGKTTRYAYDGAHNLEQITDPRGNSITMTYDGSGRVRSVDHAGSVTRFAYDTGSSVCAGLAGTKSTTVTDPNGHDTVYCVDSEFRVVRTKQPLMDPVTSTFDADSNEKEVGAEGALTVREFDTRNRLESQTSPMNVSASFLYEDSQHPFRATKYTNPQNKSLRFDYEDHNLVSITDDLGFEQRFTYNPDGTMATSRDQRGNVTSYSYDAKGNRTGTDHPAPLGDESFTYDALSRIRTMTDGKGQTRTFDYDPLDRIVKVTFSDGSSVSYTHDENGNRITRSDHTGSTDFLFYDALNRLKEEKLPEPRTILYTYDLAGNLKTFSDGGGVVSYDYNAADQVTALTEPGGHRTTFAYDNRGNRTEVAFPNSVKISTDHDLSHRVETIEATKPGSPALVSLIDDYTSGSGERALRQTVRDMRQGTTTSYSYDHLDRLTSAQSPGETWTYSYDPTSNRTQEYESVTDSWRSYSYNAANQLTGRGGASYTYDLNGNTLTEAGGNSFSYDPKDHTTQISGEAFKYAGATQFELTNHGATTYTNTLLGISRRGSDHFTRDPRGMLLGQRTPSNRYYPIADSLGSIVAVTDKDGNLVGRHDYEPFGAEQGSPAFNSPFRFAGELYHPNHKLYKIGARWYDPKLGRWTQPDLVEQPKDPIQSNRYLYAAQDPVNVTDPSGLWIGEDIWDGVEDAADEVDEWCKLNCEDLVDGTKKLIDLPDRLYWGWDCGTDLGKGSLEECDPVEFFLGDDSVEDAE
jgi:RHS repeat-associated protein